MWFEFQKFDKEGCVNYICIWYTFIIVRTHNKQQRKQTKTAFYEIGHIYRGNNVTCSVAHKIL